MTHGIGDGEDTFHQALVDYQSLHQRHPVLVCVRDSILLHSFWSPKNTYSIRCSTDRSQY